MLFRLLPLLLIAAMAAAQAPREPGPLAVAQEVKNPIEANDASLAAGKQVFERYCVSCHAKDGKGSAEVAKTLPAPPSDLTDKEWKYGGTDGELFSVIHAGTKLGMEPFHNRLSDNRIWHVVNYLRSLGKGAETGAAGGDETSAAATPVDGGAANPVAYSDDSIARGKQYYVRLCVVCHGRSGTGDTEMREFLGTPPSDLTDDEWVYGDSDAEIFTIIKQGTEYDMEAFHDRLTDEQIWHVVNFLRSIGPEPPQ